MNLEYEGIESLVIANPKRFSGNLVQMIEEVHGGSTVRIEDE